MINWSALASIRVFDSSCRVGTATSSAAGRRVGFGDMGRARHPRSHRRMQPCRPLASVSRGRAEGQTGAGREVCSPDGDRRSLARHLRPYTADLVSRRPWGCLFEIVEKLVLTLLICIVIQNFV